jgi:hypothetical protein
MMNMSLTDVKTMLPGFLYLISGILLIKYGNIRKIRYFLVFLVVFTSLLITNY